MHEARGCDQFVGRITMKVEASRRSSDCQVERPHVEGGEGALDIRIIEIQSDPAELGELCQFPQDDGGHAPGLPGQKIPLARSYVASQGVNQDVRIKIQHWRPIWRPWRECLRELRFFLAGSR